MRLFPYCFARDAPFLGARFVGAAATPCGERDAANCEGALERNAIAMQCPCLSEETEIV